MIPDLDPKDSLGRDPWAPAEVARHMTGPLEKGGGALSLGCQCGHLAIAMPPSWPWSRHVHLPSHLSRALVTTCVRPPGPRPPVRGRASRRLPQRVRPGIRDKEGSKFASLIGSAPRETQQMGSNCRPVAGTLLTNTQVAGHGAFWNRM